MKNSLICGGGIAGLTLAECLCRQWLRPLIVEAAEGLHDGGYMLDFFGPGVDVAERLGLLPALETIRAPVDDIVVLDGDGHESESVPYKLLRERLFNTRHFTFMRGDLQRVLYAHVRNRCETRFGVTIDAIEASRTSVYVRLSDRSVHDVDLLVGADGVHSVVRRLSFGADSDFTRPLGYYWAACVLDRVAPSIDPRRAFVTIAVPNRQVSIYPTPDGGAAVFFLHRAKRHMNGVQSQDDACRELDAVYGDLGGFVPGLLARCTAAGDPYFDGVDQIHMPRWHVRRSVLVGDACQCLSPLGGQGASMAMAGAFVLAEELAAGDDVQDALDRYERRMQPIIAREQKAARRMARWLVPASLPRIRLRNLALRWSTERLIASIVRRRIALTSRV